MEKSSHNPNKEKVLKKMSYIATLGGLLFGYDTGVLNGALTFMKRPDQLNLTPITEGIVTSSILFGCAFGAIFGGRLSDKYGRKTIIKMLAFVFFISTLGCAVSPDATILSVCRFVLGLAVGGASVTVPTFLAEVAPTHLRGSIVTQNEFMILVGMTLAYIFNAILGNFFGENAGIWRYMIAIASIPAVLLWLGMFLVPETPRWLAANNKIGKALEVLKEIRDEADANVELREIQENIEAEKHLDLATFKDLATPWIRRLVLIGIGIGVVQQTAGINVMLYYGTTILEETGLGTKVALIANVGNGVISLLATVLFIKYFGNRYGRKRLFFNGLAGTTASMVAISIVSNTMQGSPMFPYAVMVCIIVYLFFFQSCLGPLAWLMLSEIFPLRLRGLGMGIAVFFLWITDFFVGLLFPVMLANLGLSGSFIVFAALGVFGLIFIHKCLPETRGKSLEEIEQSFREHENTKSEISQII